MLYGAMLRRWAPVPGAVLALLLVAAPAALAAAVHPMGPWGYSRRISSPGQAAYIRLAIPDDVAAASRPDLADLRVADDQGREVGYLQIPGAAGRQDLLFFRSPEHQYRLLYGNPTAAPPAYGIEVPAGAASEAGQLGAQEANPYYGTSPDVRSLTWPRRYPAAFYSIAGGVLVLLFGGMYRRTALRMRRGRQRVE